MEEQKHLKCSHHNQDTERQLSWQQERFGNEEKDGELFYLRTASAQLSTKFLGTVPTALPLKLPCRDDFGIAH